MRTVTTNVYTYDELDERARERAADWWREASAPGACQDISEMLTDAVREAYGPGAEIWEWDYYRSSVTVRGRLGDMGPGEGSAFRGWRLADRWDVLEDVEISDPWPAAGDIVWSRDTGGWVDSEASLWDETPDTIGAYVAAVESVLVRIMVAEMDYRDSAEYIAEVMEANEYTFTSEGGRFG